VRRIDRAALQKIWASAQLTPEFLPGLPTSEKALKTAVRKTEIGQADG